MIVPYGQKGVYVGRGSTKKDKSISQTSREALGLTREKASEVLGYLSPEKIEKIENAKVNIQPEDVVAMANGYKAPGLCNYYCANECPIGQRSVPEVKMKELSQITIETLSALSKIEKETDRLVEIVEDGKITPDEYEDFLHIKSTLDKISLSVDSLQLWVDQAVADGTIDEEALKKKK